MLYPKRVHTKLNRVRCLLSGISILLPLAASGNSRDLPDSVLTNPQVRDLYETRILPGRDCDRSFAGYVLDPDKDAPLFKMIDALRLAEEVISGRGNGAVVFLKDGGMRFADMLTDEELKAVV